MGILNASTIQQGLIGAGRSPQTPVAIVSKATTAAQQRFFGPLGALTELAAHPELEMPALMIIGEVVGLADSLHWFEPEAKEQTFDEAQLSALRQ